MFLCYYHFLHFLRLYCFNSLTFCQLFPLVWNFILLYWIIFLCHYLLILLIQLYIFLDLSLSFIFCSYSCFIAALLSFCKEAESLHFSLFWEIKHFLGIKILPCGDTSSALFFPECCFTGVPTSGKGLVGLGTDFS